MYLLALSTTNSHGWKAQIVFYFFSLLSPSISYPIAPNSNFKFSKHLNHTHFLNVLLWNLLSFCSFVPQKPHNSTVQRFLQLFPITIIKKALHYKIFNQNILNNLHFYSFCAGFNFNFTHIFQICITKLQRIYNTTF